MFPIPETKTVSTLESFFLFPKHFEAKMISILESRFKHIETKTISTLELCFRDYSKLNLYRLLNRVSNTLKRKTFRFWNRKVPKVKTISTFELCFKHLETETISTLESCFQTTQIQNYIDYGIEFSNYPKPKLHRVLNSASNNLKRKPFRLWNRVSKLLEAKTISTFVFSQAQIHRLLNCVSNTF